MKNTARVAVRRITKREARTRWATGTQLVGFSNSTIDTVDSYGSLHAGDPLNAFDEVVATCTGSRRGERTVYFYAPDVEPVAEVVAPDSVAAEVADSVAAEVADSAAAAIESADVAAEAASVAAEAIADRIAKVKHPDDRVGGLYEATLKGVRAGMLASREIEQAARDIEQARAGVHGSDRAGAPGQAGAPAAAGERVRGTDQADPAGSTAAVDPTAASRMPGEIWDTTDTGENSTDAEACRAVRPGTLGYQLCWLPAGHETGPIGPAHLSQDRKQWIAPTGEHTMSKASDYSAAHLATLPTLEQGHDADLKIQTDTERVWLSRMSAADGATGSPIRVERLRADGTWG